MANLLPARRPRASRSVVEEIASLHWLANQYELPLHDPTLVAVRGYYRDTMGKRGKNDRGIYDDAFFVVSPTCFATFNGNVDPSVYREGVATVCSGIHWCRPGKHGISGPRPYPAFRPATVGERLPVSRDGQSEPTYGVATNIHRGGRTTTSSLG